MAYYLKKLGSQELGSGTGARGRYIYISKSVLTFFPPLSTHITNDMSVLSIINVSLDPNRSIYCSYVYHNDKLTMDDGTRDEYRLYLNTDIDPDRSYFNESDIILLHKVEGLPHTYKLYRFTNTDPLYTLLDDTITTSPIRGGHALVDDVDGFDPIETEVNNVETVVTDEVNNRVRRLVTENEVLFDDDEIASGAHLFNSDIFRNFVLNGYGEVCAVTGEVIKWRGFNNLEAAHIKPKAHHGPFLPSNGICMSKDLHWAFDKGFFTINNDFTIMVHPEISNTLLNGYNGQSIQVPTDSFFQPNTRYLEYHQENIYGLFLRSGQIRRLP